MARWMISDKSLDNVTATTNSAHSAWARATPDTSRLKRAAGMKLLALQGLRPFRGAAWPQAVLPNREVCDSQKDPNEVNNVALDMKKNGDTQF